MKSIRRSGKWLVLGATFALLWGCTIHELERPVALTYVGAAPAARFRDRAQAPTILIAPAVDERVGKRHLGQYRWYNYTYQLISRGASVAGAVESIVTQYLNRSGFRIQQGAWDGRLETLGSIPTDYALHIAIGSLDFSGRGVVPKMQTQGKVRVAFRLGSKADRKVWRREVEVSPEDTQFALPIGQEKQVAEMGGLIRRTVSRAVRDGLSELLDHIAP